MESETVLDSVEFHFTPTKTRCDFVIFANGRTEKLASGLANPFLVQLKAAQDQIANVGGYSISLMPDSTKEKTWFTKGTVERFVRFVNNPEVLERVSTIEAEISHIAEAITIHSNFHLGIKTLVHLQKSCAASIKGHTVVDAYKEKEADLNQEKNSNVRLLRVLESRKSLLQKRQEMAFGRALTAGFNPDHIRHLVLFAACFGASRLLEACLRYMKLWKKKHETGLRSVEIEANRVVKSPSKFSSLEIPAILISNEEKKQTEEKVSAHSQQFSSLSHGSEFPVYGGHPNGVYFPGQYQAPPYAQWWMHPSPVGHFYQHYPGEMMHFNSCYSSPNTFIPTTRESSQSCGSRKDTFCAKNIFSAPTNDRKEFGVPKDDSKNCVFSTEKEALKQRKVPAYSNKHNVSELDDVWLQSKVKTEEEMDTVYQPRNDYEYFSSDSESGDGFYPQPKSDKEVWQVLENFAVRNANRNSYPDDRVILSGEKEIYYKRKETSISSSIYDGNHERSSTPEQSMGKVKGKSLNLSSNCNGQMLKAGSMKGQSSKLSTSKNVQTSERLKERLKDYKCKSLNLSTNCNGQMLKVGSSTVKGKSSKLSTSTSVQTSERSKVHKGKSLNSSTNCNGQMLKVGSSIVKSKSSKSSTSANVQTSKRLKAYKPEPQEIKEQKEKAYIKRLETAKKERKQKLPAMSSSAAYSPMNPPSMIKNTLPVKFPLVSGGRESNSALSCSKKNTKTSSSMLSEKLNSSVTGKAKCKKTNSACKVSPSLVSSKPQKNEGSGKAK